MRPEVTAKGQAAFRSSGMQLLDPVVLRERRFDVGLSTRGLSALLGVSTQLVDRLEHGGRQNQLTIGFVADYAKQLGCDIADLLTIRASREPDDPDLIGDTDAAELGAVLAAVGGWVSLDAAAVALGWTLERIQLAAEGLADVLRPAGQVLAWRDDHLVQVAPAPSHANTPMAAAATSDGPLRIPWTRILHQLTKHGVVARPGSVDPKALGVLRNAGLITTATVDGVRSSQQRIEGPRLTDEGRDALWLD